MVDLHCHILPGVDDGAQSLADSLAMAKAAEQEGIRTIYATPHHQTSRYMNEKAAVVQKVQQLNEYLQSQSVNVTIMPGQEVRIYGDIVSDYEAGEIITLGEKYVLIEFPSNHVPKYATQILFDLQLKGITPIIVHPERNSQIIENPEILYHLVNEGAATQVTAGSVSGQFGKKIQKFSLDLIEANLTHFIASDAHNVSTRSFKMVDAFEQIDKKFGGDFIHLFKQNAQFVLEGNDIDRDIPQLVKKKKFLGIF